MSDHQLTGCRNRALFQIEHAQQYIGHVVPHLSKDEEDPNRQFLYKSTVLMLHSFFEEYLRCVVSLGASWKTQEVREHLAQGQIDPEKFVLMPFAEVSRHAQERVRFDKGAARLKAIVHVIAGRSPFADSDAEAKYLDFANVRNIIAHRGGWPDEHCARIVKTAGVIVETGTGGTSKFYKLLIRSSFIGDSLAAMGRSIQTLEEALAKDPVFNTNSLRGG